MSVKHQYIAVLKRHRNGDIRTFQFSRRHYKMEITSRQKRPHTINKMLMKTTQISFCYFFLSLVPNTQASESRRKIIVFSMSTENRNILMLHSHFFEMSIIPICVCTFYVALAYQWRDTDRSKQYTSCNREERLFITDRNTKVKSYYRHHEQCKIIKIIYLVNFDKKLL